jgi:coenzyme F420 hydrogenase subunit beta
VTEKKTIEWIVEAGLCTQCGWCVPNCPTQAIVQCETPSGYLFPRVEADKCTLCGLCGSICSGWHLENGIQDEKSDSFKGPVLGAFCGYATEPEIRSKSQSGGIVSALLCYQLESGCIDRALVAKMPRDGSLRPFALFAKTPDEVLSAGGSKYCPIHFGPELCLDLKNTVSITIVGISCQIQTIRNVQARLKKKQERIGLTIGLFCDRILSHLAIDQLCEKVGCAMEDAADFHYRSKERNGWPGEVRIEEHGGQKHFLVAQERIRIKDTFTPARCRVCFDKMNVLSDIAVGDAYGLRNDKRGYSVVLARTQRGLDVLRRAQEAGYIVLEAVESEAVFRGQKTAVKRRDWSAYTAAWESMGRVTPNFGLSSHYRSEANSRRTLKQKKIKLLRSERLATQPSRELALEEARHQLVMQRVSGWFSWKRLRKHVGKRLHFLKGLRS